MFIDIGQETSDISQNLIGFTFILSTMSKAGEYTDLFVIKYDGRVGELKDYMNSIEGITSLEWSEAGEKIRDDDTGVVEHYVLKPEIRYDTSITTPKQIEDELRDFDGVIEIK
jgi:hypothetical protein